MRTRARINLQSLLVGSTLRYAITGIVVAIINLSGPVILNAATGLTIEACIPLVYALALCVHFTSQRLFVWRHATGFALAGRTQVGRYAASAGAQYGLVAGLTAWLPGLLGWPQRVVYVLVAVTVTCVFFLVLRGFVFHPQEHSPVAVGVPADAVAGDESELASVRG